MMAPESHTQPATESIGESQGKNTAAPEQPAIETDVGYSDFAAFQSLLELPQSSSAVNATAVESSAHSQGAVTASTERVAVVHQSAPLPSSANTTTEALQMAERATLANMGARLAQRLKEAGATEQALVFSLNGADNRSILVSAYLDQDTGWQIALAVEGHELRHQLEQSTTELTTRIAGELNTSVTLMISGPEEAP